MHTYLLMYVNICIYIYIYAYKHVPCQVLSFAHLMIYVPRHWPLQGTEERGRLGLHQVEEAAAVGRRERHGRRETAAAHVARGLAEELGLGDESHVGMDQPLGLQEEAIQVQLQLQMHLRALLQKWGPQVLDQARHLHPVLFQDPPGISQPRDSGQAGPLLKLAGLGRLHRGREGGREVVVDRERGRRRAWFRSRDCVRVVFLKEIRRSLKGPFVGSVLIWEVYHVMS